MEVKQQAWHVSASFLNLKKIFILYKYSEDVYLLCSLSISPCFLFCFSFLFFFKNLEDGRLTDLSPRLRIPSCPCPSPLAASSPESELCVFFSFWSFRYAKYDPLKAALYCIDDAHGQEAVCRCHQLRSACFFVQQVVVTVDVWLNMAPSPS